ncbi:MAG: efflux RND transporter periplasmic adaptor subunit [Polyangiaceae bacterium]
MTSPPHHAAATIPPAPAPRSGVGMFALGVVVALSVAACVGLLMWPKPPAAAEVPASYKAAGDIVEINPKAPPPMRFETAAVESGPPLRRTALTARVTTFESRTSPAFAPLEGRVAQAAVRLGDRVKEGDRLIEVRSGDLASMQRDVATAQLAVRTKQAMVERLQKLVESRAVSQSDLMVAQSELAEAQLGVSAASAKLSSLQVRQQSSTSYWVLASRAGTVVQLDAAVGKEVGPDKDKPVATIADIDEVVVVVDVPERDMPGVTVAQEVSIRMPGATNECARGVIDSLSEVVDPDRQTTPVRIRVPNPNHTLKPNAFVEAIIEAPRGAAVMQTSSNAVVSDGARSVVFVETSPGKFQRRQVEVGRQNRERVELKTGVKVGERVVTRGALLLLSALDPTAEPPASSEENKAAP